MYEHKKRLTPGFATRYGLDALVYFEVAKGPRAAIAREKQIKGWLRRRKLALIDGFNPEWKDLSRDLLS
jgi:putative endonuclease